MNRAPAFAPACLLVLLAGCRGESDDLWPKSAFTSDGDAAVIAAVTGTYTGATAQGPLTLTLCEDLADEPPAGVLNDFEVLDAQDCVAHDVLGGGRGKTEDVRLGPADAGAHAAVSCWLIAATPVRATITIGDCAPIALHGALGLTIVPEADPYVPPFPLTLRLDDVDELVSGSVEAVGSLDVSYSDDLLCQALSSGFDLSVSLKRSDAEGCAGR